ncbi:MAG TPA: rhomboid family intramembrane serine protease, partial [Longimicrobiaceae bacterium]|nr:rhomboid family intramembrane serine protease [Longimicrobiaceae bacterium]
MAYSPGYSNPFGFVVTPWVKRLLIANAAVFLVTLAFSGLVPYLVFRPVDAIPRIWTLVTYMFVHVGVFHLLFNMLALFFFGPPLEDRWGSHEFVKFYLIAGLGGALLSLVFPNQAIAGASGAVYGVLVAFAMFWPDNRIYIWGIFPVKAKWLVTFLVGLDLFYAMSGGGAGGVARLAHLGGALAAFLYLKSPLAPPEWGQVPRTRLKKRRTWRVLSALNALRPEEKTDEAAAAARDTRVREAHRALDDVDEILDKISAGGMASL